MATGRLKVKAVKKVAGKTFAPKPRNKPKSPDRETQFRLLFGSLSEIKTAPVGQHVFHPERKWRFDFAWPDLLVAVEIDGGVFQSRATGHRSIGGLIRDMEKSNAAQIQGWCLLRFHANDLDKDPVGTIALVDHALMISAGRLGKPAFLKVDA